MIEDRMVLEEEGEAVVVAAVSAEKVFHFLFSSVIYPIDSAPNCVCNRTRGAMARFDIPRVE